MKKRNFLCGLMLFFAFGFLVVLLRGQKIIFENVTASLAGADIINQNKNKELVQKTEKENQSKIILVAGGDIMLDRGVEFKLRNYGDNNFRFPFFKIKDYFEKADIIFANLESVISNKGRKQGTIYSFRAEPEAIDGLVYSGINIVSVANNHVFDYGLEAFSDSLARLKENKIDYVGGGLNEAEAFSLKIKNVKGAKLGFLAYSNIGSELWQAKEDNTGIAFLTQENKDKIKQDIKKSKEQVDILIVSMHWGDEYISEPNYSQVSLAREILENGADIIIGHHPHVAQDLREYENNKWAVYSLGNLVFDQYFSEQTMEGNLLEVIIEDKKIKEVNKKEIKLNEYFQPEIVEDMEKQKN